MKRALMLTAILATLALPLTAAADSATKAAGTAAGTTAKAETMAKAAMPMEIHSQKLANATWEDAPGYPAGVKMAKIHRDATISCGYLKFPTGIKIAVHTHPGAHNATIISGTGMFGTDKDPKGWAMGPGDYVHIPAGMPHWFTATTELIAFGAITGPDGIAYLNPSDDPSKGQATTAH
jgi:quercetin dioxygenase-like cupin family protein